MVLGATLILVCLKKVKCNGFTVSIISLFSLLYLTYLTNMMYGFIKKPAASKDLINAIASVGMAGYFYAHWLYCSQYIKTYQILPCLHRIAVIHAESEQDSFANLQL